MSRFQPKLEALPPAQRRLWPELREIPNRFVLYGGTGLALRLGHRQSVDFDFFSSDGFAPDELASQIPSLVRGDHLQSSPSTLTVSVHRGGPVKLSFFGGLRLGRVGEPDQAEDNGIGVASMLDLAATKMAVLQQRAEKRDYLDIYAILQAGVGLLRCLGAAQAVYGDQFNPAITLKALTYFRDGDLPTLPDAVKARLSRDAVNVEQIPLVPRLSDQLAASL